MSEHTPTKEIQTTVELPGTIVDDIADQLGDSPSALAIRDACYDRVDRDTAFVTADGKSVAQAVRDQ
jgi:hypothetical protein